MDPSLVVPCLVGPCLVGPCLAGPCLVGTCLVGPCLVGKWSNGPRLIRLRVDAGRVDKLETIEPGAGAG